MTSLAIVGGGPNATYTLERLAAVLARRHTHVELDLHVYDRGDQFGDGAIHSRYQPRSTYLNRIVSEVGFAADEALKGVDDLIAPKDRPTC